MRSFWVRTPPFPAFELHCMANGSASQPPGWARLRRRRRHRVLVLFCSLLPPVSALLCRLGEPVPQLRQWQHHLQQQQRAAGAHLFNRLGRSPAAAPLTAGWLSGPPLPGSEACPSTAPQIICPSCFAPGAEKELAAHRVALSAVTQERDSLREDLAEVKAAKRRAEQGFKQQLERAAALDRELAFYQGQSARVMGERDRAVYEGEELKAANLRVGHCCRAAGCCAGCKLLS